MKSPSTTKAWQACIAGKGLALGLENCRVFLENKYLNDVFFEGTFKGRPCVVKCSSKCPWSIGNEYRVGRRLFEIAPDVVPEPLVWNEAPAFVAVEKVQGPSLTELLKHGVTEAMADVFAADIVRMARALLAAGVVHRDVFSDNLLLGADGHLKLIDMQLSIDRSDMREDPWIERHWKYHYVVFGARRDMGLGVWNDVGAFRSLLARLPHTAGVAAADGQLAKDEAAATLSAPPRGFTLFKLWMYALSLRVQMAFARNRPEKHARLERRFRKIVG